MATYKVGDKVNVRSDLNTKDMYEDAKGNRLYAVTDMLRLAGKTVTISRIQDNHYTIKEDGGKWKWLDVMLETNAKEIKLEGKEKFEIKSYKVTNNRVIEVEFVDGDKQKSVCMNGDTFDAERGLEVCIMKHILGKAKYHKVLKDANRQLVALEEKAKKDAEEKAKVEKKKAKAEKQKAARKAKKRAENIADMTEAFSAALKANGVDANVKDVSDGVLSKIFNAFKN